MKIKIISLISVIVLSLFVTVVFLAQQLLQITPPQPAYLSAPQRQPIRINGWSLYSDVIHSFSIQHPTSSTPIIPVPRPEQSGASHILHLSTATNNTIGTLSIARSDDPIIGVNVYTSADTLHCLEFQSASSTVIMINGVPFKTAMWSDAAMGGERGIIHEYRTLRDKTCTIIESIVHYRDIEFLASVTGATPHTASTADIRQQIDWIDQQHKTQTQIVSTFQFSR